MWGNINELYSVILILFGKTCLNLFIIPIVLKHYLLFSQYVYANFI